MFQAQLLVLVVLVLQWDVCVSFSFVAPDTADTSAAPSKTKLLAAIDCCSQSTSLCAAPCAGTACTAICDVRCGFLGATVCAGVLCSVANAAECTTPCADGYTEVGSKCIKVVAGPANYLDALKACCAEGGDLATVESQAEQDAVYALTGGASTWIGLTDFLDEGTFVWVDGTAVSYTNWRNNAPNNGGGNQHCVQMRPDGEWDDVLCKKSQAYACQTAVST